MKRNNALNLIRIMAAFEVLYSHTDFHLGLGLKLFGEGGGYHLIDQFIRWIPGVPLFFILSGFLIWDSTKRSSNYFDYLKKRFWRIYPELWGGVFISALTIVWLYRDNIVLKDFLLFLFTQSTIFQFWTPDSLRGFGCGTPNGSLWTICAIIQYYLVAWFVTNIFQGRSLRFWLLAFVISFGFSAFGAFLKGNVPVLLAKLYGQTLFMHFWMFLTGAFISEFKSPILNILKKYWYAFVGVSLVFYWLHVDLPLLNYPFIKSVFASVGLIGFAYRFPRLEFKTDISYSVYIYHMIFVNVFIDFGFLENKVLMIYIILLTFVSSYISTQTLGRFGLSMKKRHTTVQ